MSAVDNMDESIASFRDSVLSEWRDNIAPFWIRYGPDDVHGGFRGWITNDLRIDGHADKGIILNSRILWTFARAFNLFGDTEYGDIATRAFGYLTGNFIDKDFGGVFWTVDYLGQASDTKKRTYAQAFAIYALTEYFVATQDQTALDHAMELFQLIESRCRDGVNDGYFETFDRDWSMAADQRLSDVDQDDKKSMNAHLHVLEAYTLLAQTTNDAQVMERLSSVLSIFLDHILNPDATYVRMFFDEDWTPKSAVRSFGHDIEASWLLFEAAEIVGDVALLERVRSVSLTLANSVAELGLDSDGSLLYEAKDGAIIEEDKDWWVQAEAVVGFVNAWQLGGEPRFLQLATNVWTFILDRIVDRKNGEWFWKITRDGRASDVMPKLSQWKCPYHNGRMCFEIHRRLGGASGVGQNGSHPV